MGDGYWDCGHHDGIDGAVDGRDDGDHGDESFRFWTWRRLEECELSLEDNKWVWGE